MSIVIDASVALKWVLDEPESNAAEALRTEEMIAPALWLAEAANALWRGARIGQLTDDEAESFLVELTNAPIATLAMEPYIDRASKLATEINHPVFDCIYLALALRRDTYVVTADHRFAAVAQCPGLAGRIRLLGS